MTEETQQSASEELEIAQPGDEPDSSKSSPQDRETEGPFDILEVRGIRPYVDFGSIKIVPREGLQLRLEVDERAKRVVAVTVDYEGSVLQVQAFSAPKTTGLWHRVRGEIAQQLGAQGGKVQESTGELGAELFAIAPVPAEQGGGVRRMRFLAVDGPRWMLRGVIMGRATEDEAASAKILEVFHEIVVVRGDQPMPPSELLPLQVPAGVAPNALQGAAEA